MGYDLFSLEYQLSAGKPFPQNNEHIVYKKLQHFDDFIFITLVLEQECSVTKYASSWPRPRTIDMQFQLLKIKEIRIILASLHFSLSWRKIVSRVEKWKTWWLLYGLNSTSRIGCFAVLLKTFLNTCKQLCKKNGYM